MCRRACQHVRMYLGTPCGGEVLHVCIHCVSRETPDVTPCRTSPPMPVFCTCLVRNAWCNTMLKLGTIQRILAWPLRKDDTHTSRSVSKIFLAHEHNHIAFGWGPRRFPACLFGQVGVPQASRRPLSGLTERESPRRRKKVAHRCLWRLEETPARTPLAMQSSENKVPYRRGSHVNLAQSNERLTWATC